MNFQFLRKGYRLIVPEAARRCVRRVLIRDDDGYSSGFFDSIESLQAASYPIMAETIVERFKPRNVIDIGCGSGGLIGALIAFGGIRCAGIEYSRVGRDRCTRRGLPCEFGDMTKPLILGAQFDFAICLEVAEHLPASHADQLVSNLASGPDRLLFSAATPGQGGKDHLNEQPKEYWIEKFDRRGFGFQQSISDEIRSEWASKRVANWFANNVMVFIRVI